MSADTITSPRREKPARASFRDACEHGFHFCKRCQAIVEPDDRGGCSDCGAHFVNVRFHPPIPKP